MSESSPQKPPNPPVTWEQAVEQFKRHNPAHPPGTPACKPTEAQMQARARLWERSKHLIEDRLTGGGEVERAEQ